MCEKTKKLTGCRINIKTLWTWCQIKYIHPLITFCIQTKKPKEFFCLTKMTMHFWLYSIFFCLESSFLYTEKIMSHFGIKGIRK